MRQAWQPRVPRIRSIFARAAEGDVYIPHPAPDAAVDDDGEGSTMGFVSVLKTLVIPAIISLILYLIISYLIVPAWKRYRNKYGQYLPIDAISTRTTSFRQRLQGSIVRAILPSSWREQFRGARHAESAQDGSGSEFDEDEGEELYNVDANRREAISLDARRRDDIDDGRRLSRDLEEGFKDESDDEGEPDSRRRSISR